MAGHDEDIIEIVKRSFQSYEDSNREAAEAVIADDFHFTSPLDNRIDRTTYFQRCWPNHETCERFEFVRLVPHGDEVIVTYEGTSTNGHVFRNTEVLTVNNGQIVEVEVYFGWNVPHGAPVGGYLDADED